VLISPNLSVSIPIYTRPLKHFPDFIIEGLKPLVIFLVKNFSFRSDKNRISGFIKALENGKSKTLIESSHNLSPLQISRKDLEIIDVPTLVIGTISDEIHNINHAKKTYDYIPNCDIEYLPTFGDAHSSRCAKIIRKWLSK